MPTMYLRIQWDKHKYYSPLNKKFKGNIVHEGKVHIADDQGIFPICGKQHQFMDIWKGKHKPEELCKTCKKISEIKRIDKLLTNVTMKFIEHDSIADKLFEKSSESSSADRYFIYERGSK